MIPCAVCETPKPRDDFYVKDKATGRLDRTCKACRADQQREYHKKNPGLATSQARKWAGDNPDRRREINRNSGRKTRSERRARVISYYGSKCACCGEDREPFLTIDHIGGREGKHVGANSAQVMRYIELEGFPAGKYRVLCWNCNCAIGIYGSCPHEGEQ